MDTEKLKGFACSASRLVATSAQLAKKQAELATLNNVTLPKLYYSVGKRVARLVELPPELAPFRERIKSLQEGLDKSQESTQPAPEQLVSGFAAKAKQVAQQVAQKASQAMANASAQVQIQAAYVACGKEAVQRFGLKAIPKELQADWTAANDQIEKLTSEITELQAKNSVGAFTPRRLVLAGGFIASVLLALFLLRSVGGFLFGGSRTDNQYASAQETESPSRTTNTPSAPGAVPGVAKADNQRWDGVQQPSGGTVRDRAVELALGETSQKYQPRGFKGIELGAKFDALHTESPLNWTAFNRDYTFLNAADGKESFYFNDHDALICYVKSYTGGIDDYLDQLIEIFGKTTKDPVTKNLRPAAAAFTKTSSFIEYAFPRVLVQVQFTAVANTAGGSSQTHVIVLDRDWAERMLIAHAAVKRRCLMWMQEATEPASMRNLTVGSAPSFPGATPQGTGRGLSFYEDKRLQRLTRAEKHENDVNRRIQACCGWYGLDGLEASPAIVVQFNHLDSLVRSSPLKRGGNNVVPVDADFGYWNAVNHTPFLSDLDDQVNLVLMQEFFPPRTDKIRFKSDESNPYKPDVHEWETDHPTGRWTVKCFANGRVQLVLADAKKL